MSSLLIAGGIYHVCWALFDSSWPRLFAWKRTLALFIVMLVGIALYLVPAVA